MGMLRQDAILLGEVKEARMDACVAGEGAKAPRQAQLWSPPNRSPLPSSQSRHANRERHIAVPRSFKEMYMPRAACLTQAKGAPSPGLWDAHRLRSCASDGRISTPFNQSATSCSCSLLHSYQALHPDQQCCSSDAKKQGPCGAAVRPSSFVSLAEPSSPLAAALRWTSWPGSTYSECAMSRAMVSIEERRSE